ncbi:MAG: YSIRK-type signal peptide-containing protein [Lactobacillus iners]|nr:YSIRK-type signal peptide-containing protein [Lactobacillus iners]
MKKERLDKFSIRKLTVGAASVLIGVAFGATTVSAEKQPAPQASAAGQQAAEVTELKDVKFTFKMGDKSATTRAVTIYATKDGHYGFEKDAAKCTSTAAQIVSTFLDSVSDDAIKNAQGVAYPEKIVAGENTVELATKPASNPVEHSDADLQKEAEKKETEDFQPDQDAIKAQLAQAEHDLQVAKDAVEQAEQEGGLSQEEMAKLQDEVAKAEATVTNYKKNLAKAELFYAKEDAHKALNDAGITGDIFHKAIDAAKTVAGVNAYVAETLAAHKTVEPVTPTPVTPTPAPVVSGETGIGYLNLDMLSDGFTGTLYVPVVGKDVNCKVRLLDDAGKYTNDYVVTDTTIKALASKVVNGVTFYKVAENRWIPAKFAEVLSDKEVAFKGVAKTFVKGHANYAVAMLDADGKYTGKFLKQGSSFKVFAKKVINGHLCYRLGTQAQWVPARFLVF